MSTVPLLEPSLEDAVQGGSRWMTVIFNNDHTPMDVVVQTLMTATGCDAQEAYIEMWEAHTFGKAACHFSSRETCEAVASVIERAGVQTEVCLEWPE
jgi:ATP-dependent Clp protease adaptor protein ClpS